MSSHVSRVRSASQFRGSGAPLARAVDMCDVSVVHLDAVRAARAALPNRAGIVRLADLYGLLSNATRLKIVLALRASAKKDARRELCVCDLAVVAGASKSMTSHQLRLLRTAGVVVPRRVGKMTYYRLADSAFPALIALR